MADDNAKAPLATSHVPDPDLLNLFDELFANYRLAHGHGTEVVDFDADLWASLASLGLTLLTAAEDNGGSGGSWREAAALVAHAAGAAAPVPLVENDLLAAWLLNVAGLPGDERVRTACRPDPCGHAAHVPFGRAAESVVTLWSENGTAYVADISRDRVAVEEARNLAGEPSDTLTFDLADLRGGVVVDAAVAEHFRLRGALARCIQVCGGMERVLEIVLHHVAEREQFGRPIAKFQTVQNLVADIAAEAALARAATDAAVELAVRSDWEDPGLLFAVATAKSVSGHGASVVVRNAHQVIGAIGTTLEHELHTLTQPILVHRAEFGSTHSWDETLTRLAMSAGQERLWPLIITGSPGATA